jgi:hypothetical protein
MVVTPSRSDPDGTVHIRDQLHEILELVPVVPKLHRLSILLRDMEYDEGDEDRQVGQHAVCTERIISSTFTRQPCQNIPMTRLVAKYKPAKLSFLAV